MKCRAGREDYLLSVFKGSEECGGMYSTKRSSVASIGQGVVQKVPEARVTLQISNRLEVRFPDKAELSVASNEDTVKPKKLHSYQY